MKSQVKISREFFSKIKNDYADWKWALIREFLQNSIDAPGCDEVSVYISKIGGNTKLEVVNNGSPMTEDVLVNKLLTLGGSGKNFEGEHTGGFGVAKSLLYYTHLSFKIETGEFVVDGSGAEYSVEKTSDEFDGTRSTIVIEGDYVESLRSLCRKFASMAQWKGTLYLDSERLETNLLKGARRRDLGWCVVYTNNSFSNVCIVRINGQPMFTLYTRFKGCVLLELTGKAKDTLTSNRDNLVYQYASELSDLLTSLAVDKRSALREQKAAYKRYLGEKIANEAKQPKKAGVTIEDLIDVSQLSAVTGSGVKTEVVPQTKGGIKVTVEQLPTERAASVSLNHEFILKNTTGMVTPSYYEPGKTFSKYSREILRAWAAVMLKMYQINDVSGEFCVGFVLDEESEAEFERSNAYGNVYYVNPAKVVCQRNQPNCRSFKARFTGAWSNRFELISLAAHEFVHGAYGLGEHDEDYAGKLTDVMSVVMANLGQFTPLFRS